MDRKSYHIAYDLTEIRIILLQSITHKKKLPQVIDSQEFWEGARTDSNRRHSEPQSDALTN